MNLSNYCDICGESRDNLIALFAGPRGQSTGRRELPVAEVCTDCLTYDLVRVVAAQGLQGVIGYAQSQRASA